MIKSTHKLFADDTSLYASVNHETKHDTQGMIENDLKNIESWSTQWLVKFNSSKSESLYITRMPVDLFSNFSFEQVISIAQLHKHLVLIISKDISWKYHLIPICQKAF